MYLRKPKFHTRLDDDTTNYILEFAPLHRKQFKHSLKQVRTYGNAREACEIFLQRGGRNLEIYLARRKLSTLSECTKCVAMLQPLYPDYHKHALTNQCGYHAENALAIKQCVNNNNNRTSINRYRTKYTNRMTREVQHVDREFEDYDCLEVVSKLAKLFTQKPTGKQVLDAYLLKEKQLLHDAAAPAERAIKFSSAYKPPSVAHAPPERSPNPTTSIEFVAFKNVSARK